MATVIESSKLRCEVRGKTLPTARSSAAAEPGANGRVPAVANAVDEKIEAALSRARAAEEALAAVRGEIDAERERARERGYDEAMRSAAEEIEAERRSKIGELDALLQNLPAAADALVANAEDDILAIAFEAVGRILGRAASDRRAVRSAVRQAIRQTAADRNLVVRVSPADHAWLAPELDGLLPEHGSRRIDIVADARLHAGGCIVDSGAGAIDARFDVQLENLKRVLLGKRKDRPGDPA
jgi:flagellar assembly protein FliH